MVAELVPASPGMLPPASLSQGEQQASDRPIWLARPRSDADAFRATLDLFQTCVDLIRQNLRRRHPDAGDEEIERRLREWLRDRPCVHNVPYRRRSGPYVLASGS
jgi:hypothetical protein